MATFRRWISSCWSCRRRFSAPCAAASRAAPICTSSWPTRSAAFARAVALRARGDLRDLALHALERSGDGRLHRALVVARQRDHAIERARLLPDDGAELLAVSHLKLHVALDRAHDHVERRVLRALVLQHRASRRQCEPDAHHDLLPRRRVVPEAARVDLVIGVLLLRGLEVGAESRLFGLVALELLLLRGARDVGLPVAPAIASAC